MENLSVRHQVTKFLSLTSNELQISYLNDLEKERQEREDEEAAKMAFQTATGEKIRRYVPEEEDTPMNGDSVNWQNGGGPSSDAPAFTFKKAAKPKKDFGALLGVKKNGGAASAPSPLPSVASKATPAPAPAAAKAAPKSAALLAGYGSDSD